MLSVEKLIEEAKDPRLDRLPLYARQLIHDLAYRMDAEHRAAEGARATALKEVTEARALLRFSGPDGTDTFMDLPRALYDDAEDDDQRPLGKGTVIDFRGPEDGPGEGISVSRQEDGTVHVHGINHLAVRPVDSTYLIIEKR